MIAIIGGKNSGKTTLALKMVSESEDPLEDLIKIHTDDFNYLEWSDQSVCVMNMFKAGENVVIEGLTVVRALRKWLKNNPEGKPVDEVYYLTKCYGEEYMDSREKATHKACETIFSEIEEELEKRGVIIRKDGD